MDKYSCRLFRRQAHYEQTDMRGRLQTTSKKIQRYLRQYLIQLFQRLKIQNNFNVLLLIFIRLENQVKLMKISVSTADIPTGNFQTFQKFPLYFSGTFVCCLKILYQYKQLRNVACRYHGYFCWFVIGFLQALFSTRNCIVCDDKSVVLSRYKF